MVREVRVDELPIVAQTGLLFFEEAKLPGKLIPEIFIRSWTNLIKADLGKVLGLYEDDVFVGGLGMVYFPDLNDGELVANECFWFVRPEHRIHGLQLLKEAERIAKELSCKRMGMIYLHGEAGDRLSRIYTKLGFRPIETHHIKEF